MLGYYYVSMPYFKHRVLKCAGICPDEGHKSFYVKYFHEHGESVNSDAKNGPFTVVISKEYRGNTVHERDCQQDIVVPRYFVNPHQLEQ